ncbi:MAG: hypothetical protein E7046_07505 [Lentisphaerae bacterium]|nr:hypothetical protein [Lentisphaerota bacterium]
MAIPVIYKGDDTDFRGSTGFTLKVVTSSNLNLSGCTVEVEVLGFRKSFPASATGELVCPFAFTAAETQRMPLGIHAATVRVYDSKGRVRTINNSIRVKVTNSVHEAYGKDDPQEVTLAVSTVDLGDYAKKAEVTKAIAAAMKDASASVKLHALTPEVTDTTVTLKPVDGEANWVDGRLQVKSIRTWGGCTVLPSHWIVYFFDPDNDEEVSLNITRIFEDCEIIEVRYSVITEETTIYLRTTGINYVFDDQYGEVVGEIPADTQFFCIVMGEIQLDRLTDNPINVDLEYSDLTEHIVWEDKYASLEFVASDLTGLLEMTYNVSTPVQHLAVSLPASADATKARCFSLAVETDVETEKAVEWQGGEVVEALPGASKLAPGLTVWDVAEVAPGKFRVERASSPAQSAPLTLTAPNGRVAELAVDDDLVLEVKEI